MNANGSIRIGTTVSRAVAAASASVALPTDAAGVTARTVILTATVACYVRFGAAAVEATTTDLYLLAGESANVYDVMGFTHVAGERVTGDGTLYITCVEG